MDRSQGFTLVEVMVALAVVALALPALLLSLQQQVDGTAYIRDQSIAQLVAANKLTELRILSKASESLIKGRDSGTEAMVDRDWYWWLDSKPTPVENFYRVEIRVATDEEHQDSPLFTLVAFLSADLQSQAAQGGAGG